MGRNGISVKMGQLRKELRYLSQLFFYFLSYGNFSGDYLLIQIPVQMSYDIKTKLAMLHQPDSLKNDQFNIWSQGRGEDVWAMLCASMAGDLDTIRKLVARDPKLVNCSYAYLTPLRFAVREDQRAVIDYLIQHGASKGDGHDLITIARDRAYTELTAFFEQQFKDQYHISANGEPLAAAIREFDTEKVYRILADDPGLVDSADRSGNQPIHWAVLTRQLAVIDHLLKLGANINAMRPDGASPIDLTNGDYHYRSWYRDLPATALQKHELLIGHLIARGAYYNISVAAKMGDMDRVGILLDEDPSLVNKLPAYVSYYSGLPLRNAAGAGHLEVVRLLLKRGANPNEPEPGIAPEGGALHAALGRGHLAISKLLLEHGANPNASVESSGNCMSIAHHWGASKEVIDLLASYGGSKTVELVCYDGDIEMLSTMFRANPNLYVDQYAVDGAIQEGQQQLLELILRFQPNRLRTHALQRAVAPEFARWLMEHGLDPNRGNWLGMTPLHQAASNGNIEHAAACLEFGADIDQIDGDSFSTALGWAAREGQKEMVEWLLTKGADPRLPVEEPWALPLAWAKRRGHQEIVEILQGGK